jgi:hypothetical protein
VLLEVPDDFLQLLNLGSEAIVVAWNLLVPSRH